MAQFKNCKIEVKGNVLTDGSTIIYQVESALKEKSNDNLSTRLNKAWTSLHSLGMFDEVGITVQSKDDAETATSGSDCTILVSVNESKSYLAKVQLSTGSAGPEVELEGLLRGRLGMAECIKFAISRSERRRDFLVSLFRASPFALPLKTGIEVRQGSYNNQSWASFVDNTRSISTFVAGINNDHQLSYDVCWRDPVPSINPDNSLASIASWTVINHCRPSLKTSLRYNYTFRYKSLSNCMASLEVALPPGQARGISAYLSSKYSVDFLSNLSWSVYGSAGLLRFFNSRKYISDWPTMRFKGFDTNGFCHSSPPLEGGRPGGDRLPGNLFAQITSTIGTRFEANSPFSWFLFCSAAVMSDWNSPNILQRNSAGVGLGIDTEGGRLEITFAMPISPQETDKTRYFDINLT